MDIWDMGGPDEDAYRREAEERRRQFVASLSSGEIVTTVEYPAQVVADSMAAVETKRRRAQGRYRYGYRQTTRGRVPILTPTMIARQRALRRTRGRR